MNNDPKYLFTNLNDNTSFILEKGIYNEKLFIYFKNEYFYIHISNIRCFKVSIKRVKNTLCIKSINEVKKLFIKCINNITIEKKNDNLFYLKIFYYQNTNTIFNIINNKIKLKEVNDFLSIDKTDSPNLIIKKQNEKILSLLEKIKVYENTYKEIDTDEEMFIIY